jgi:hypothetical protein
VSIFGTKIYTVHIDPDVALPYEKPVFVREGFSVFAFLFMALWALYHRLWLAAAALIGFEVLMMWLDEAQMFSPVSVSILHLAGQVLMGFHANDLWRAKLRRKGYIMADITTGDITTGESLLRAEQRFFERFLAAS